MRGLWGGIKWSGFMRGVLGIIEDEERGVEEWCLKDGGKGGWGKGGWMKKGAVVREWFYEKEEEVGVYDVGKEVV